MDGWQSPRQHLAQHRLARAGGQQAGCEAPADVECATQRRPALAAVLAAFTIVFVPRKPVPSAFLQDAGSPEVMGRRDGTSA